MKNKTELSRQLRDGRTALRNISILKFGECEITKYMPSGFPKDRLSRDVLSFVSGESYTSGGNLLKFIILNEFYKYLMNIISEEEMKDILAKCEYTYKLFTYSNVYCNNIISLT